MSNIVRDSCDPGGIESYGVGKGHNVSYNAIHDVTQPLVLFACSPEDVESNVCLNRGGQTISLLFADAQTHYSEFKGNLMFEANACTGDGAMIKSWQTNFQNNIIADSSMPRAAWIGSYSQWTRRPHELHAQRLLECNRVLRRWVAKYAGALRRAAALVNGAGVGFSKRKLCA